MARGFVMAAWHLALQRFSRLLQRNTFVRTEGDQLFFSMQPIFEAPQLRAGRLNEKKQSVAIKRLLLF